MKAVISTLSVLFICTIIALPAIADDPLEMPTVDQVLQKYIEAVGGKAALAELTTRYCEITVDHQLGYLTSGPQGYKIEAWAKFPGKWRTLKHKEDGDVIEAFNGQMAWTRTDDGEPREFTSTNVKFPFLYDPQNALRVKDYFPELTLTGMVDMDGRQVYALESTQLDPLHNCLYFDVESGLLVNIGSYWTLEEYQEVDGVLLPHRILVSRKGGMTAFQFKKIVHNKSMKNDLFAMPAGE